MLIYAQFSQVIYTNDFGWTPDYAITGKDVAACYNEIIQQIIGDPDNILIGGFSGGNIASIEITMSNTVPVRGFISLCLSLKPKSFTPENVTEARRCDVKDIIVEGEHSGDVSAEQEMVKFSCSLIAEKWQGKCDTLEYIELL